MTNVRTTQSDNGATVSPHVGDTITVELPEVPTTGYRWTHRSADSDTLLFLGDSFELSDKAAVGGGGIHLFRFAVQRSGSAQILCTLTRSWESGPPRDTFALQVSVA